MSQPAPQEAPADYSRPLLDLKEAAEVLRVGRSTVFNLIRDGKLETVSVGRRTLVPADAIASFIQKLREAYPNG
jgi:excisionase family DNA binding protein